MDKIMETANIKNLILRSYNTLSTSNMFNLFLTLVHNIHKVFN